MKKRKTDDLGPARRMAKYIDGIISAATAGPKGQRMHSAICCIRRPRHHRCPGRIFVSEKDNGNIEWECPDCRSSGVISGWQGGWSDLSELREQDERPCFEILLPAQMYDALKKGLSTEFETDNIIYGAAYTEKGIILRANRIDWAIFAGILVSKISGDKKSRYRPVFVQVLNCIEAVFGRWDSS
jgi:hypothetical protein